MSIFSSTLISQISECSLSELRDLSEWIEGRINSLDNDENQKRYTGKEPFGSMVQQSTFTTMYDPETKEVEGINVKYDTGVFGEKPDIEYDITATNVTITIYISDEDGMINSWELTGNPDKYTVLDSCYNEDPETQQAVPENILNYALYLWGGFISN